MLTLPPSTRVFVATKPTDMRRSFDGLFALVRDFLGEDPLSGHLFVFRNRSGAPYSSDTLGDDFRDVRRALFGDRESRTLADFRRSGAVEAIAGNASAAQLAHAMGNTLSTSNSLFATYVPVNMTSIRAVMDARRVGRGRIRGHK